ncbi:MAG TPA: NADAR family protein [Gammaproteobacteria bacterium]|nr:NADAR family protein [Gammaproteobacteria bacterium]
MPRQTISAFTGTFRFLSNFYPATAEYAGTLYPTAEHAYQAAKSLDPDVRRHFAMGGIYTTPGQAKRAGRRIALRGDWEQVKVEIMRAVLRSKFTRSHVLRIKLLDTYPAELIEGNHWNDRYWGVCNGRGENMLGKLLMELRADLLINGSAPLTPSQRRAQQ